jgi:CRISPR/Cas system CSM-associated protein Csm3 (group 7 of RAMP superfamily)
MTTCEWSGDKSSKIIQRIVVQVDLRLVTPAHLGNGDGEDETDMPLMTDLLHPDRPILPGTSLAGALRAAVRRWGHGHFQATEPIYRTGKRERSHLLCGDPVDPRGQNTAHQLPSPLIVDDAIPDHAGEIEIRDGVRLNPASRTADDGGLFNAEFWKAGVVFPVRLELVLRETDPIDELMMAFAVALTCLDQAESQKTFTVGMRKRRGFGVVQAENWNYASYDLRTLAGLQDWLARKSPVAKEFAQIRHELIGDAKLPDRGGREFVVSGKFAIDGSLLIRSGTVQDDLDVDMVHLHSARKGQEVPVLSGTTLAGAIRQRCWAIAQLLGGDAYATKTVDDLFGPMIGPGAATHRPRASRIVIQEAVIAGATSGDERLIQNRVSIDRFTGGALDTALFNEQPVFGPRVNGQDVLAPLSFTLYEASDAQIGLFLLALKDLALGDLPVGGEISVGRGKLRLHGSLNLLDRQGEQLARFTIGPNGETPPDTKRETLNAYVTSLHQQAQSAAQHESKATGANA